MPIYEYECTKCGNRFEVIQGFSDPAITSCNTCSGKVIKVISAPAIVFKGSGWYVTDYSDKLKDKAKGTDEAKKPVSEAHANAEGKEKPAENKPGEAKPATSSSQTSPHPSLPLKGGG